MRRILPAYGVRYRDQTRRTGVMDRGAYPTAKIVLVPGADGRKFQEDIREARHRGFEVVALSFPPPPDHLIDPEHFARCCMELTQAVARARSLDPDAMVAAIGRNYGGTILAYVAARGLAFDALVLTGAIPEVSRYLAEGTHPGARALRESGLRVSDLQHMDIVANAHAIEVPCLIQFGTRDPYVDASSAPAAEALNQRFPVSWLDDDHAMAGSEAITQRWKFLSDAGTRARGTGEPVQRAKSDPN